MIYFLEMVTVLIFLYNTMQYNFIVNRGWNVSLTTPAILDTSTYYTT